MSVFLTEICPKDAIVRGPSEAVLWEGGRILCVQPANYRRLPSFKVSPPSNPPFPSITNQVPS